MGTIEQSEDKKEVGLGTIEQSENQIEFGEIKGIEHSTGKVEVG